MTNLGDHARRELELAGFFDKDSDYDGMLGKAVMELIQTFRKQGHSGASAQVTLALFTKLANHEPVGKYAPTKELSRDVSAESGVPNGQALQCERDSRVFSFDGGETWKCVETDRTWSKTPLQKFTEQVHEGREVVNESS